MISYQDLYPILEHSLLKHHSQNYFAKGYQQLHESKTIALLCDDACGKMMYSNALGLQLFEYSPIEFMGMPSTKTAPKKQQDHRNDLLEQVESSGFVLNYSGIRQSKSQKLFLIKNTLVWKIENLQNSQSSYGKAALILDYNFLP